ncbi:hypothetical protein [Tissierella sp. Yu-01]|uniref:hypothetical protein n=1 Tax=Tissierella sp. Yu-01 TaxID=3035694 RepID=UPI00240DF2B4|nr:hypothetical protein [Tissierella sp. Yu-01]WFA09262.1 hypothetical protein P3962_01435 [Tissierella sp. Yu-01]
MKKEYFVGTKELLYLYLRRDRFRLLIWILLPVLMLIFHSITMISLSSGKNIVSFLNEFNEDVLISAVHGPIMSLDLVGATLWRAASPITLFLGIGVILTVIRHTRTDEETGRTELIRSFSVGRYANLTAAMLLVILSTLLSSLLMTIPMKLIGGDVKEVLVFGATLFFAGIFYGGVGLLACQLKSSSSGTRNIGTIFLGLGLLINILNNMGGGDTFLRLLSPIAWSRITTPFSGGNVLGIVYCFVISVIPVFLAYTLSVKRDIGGAIFMDQTGLAEAKLTFNNPLALAWKTHKGMFMGWLFALIFVIGAFASISPSMSGSISSAFEGIAGDNWMEGMTMDLLFLNIMIYILSIFVGLYSLIAMNNLKKEEIDGRNEIILDKKIKRKKYMFSFVFVALYGSAVLLIAMGLTGGIVYSVVTNNFGNEFWQIFIMGISKIPAVWILIGTFSIFYGFFPKLTDICWAIWGFFSLLEIAWEGGIIDWSLMQLSPFSSSHYTIHVNNLSPQLLIGILLTSVILIFIGMVGYEKRDIMTRA